ncbi:MAG TPA: hypothetical protein VN950_13275 [Terriglobales bacterium]|nr:hypothetical protein [Terriglobales bacterium]
MHQANGSEDQSKDKTEECLDNFKKRFERKLRDPKFALELAGFIVLCVYAFFTILMYRANRDSADASKEASDTSKEALRTVQRAFVISDVIQHQRSARPVPLGKPEIVWQFSPVWENAGATPAVPAITYFFIDHLPVEPTEEIFIGADMDHPAFAIGPRAKKDGGIKLLTDSFVQQSRNDIPGGVNLKIFAWGWLVYRDVLPNTPTHVTEFCSHLTNAIYGLNPTANKPPATFPLNIPVTLIWEACKEHNCVDEYCKDHQRITALLSP